MSADKEALESAMAEFRRAAFEDGMARGKGDNGAAKAWFLQVEDAEARIRGMFLDTENVMEVYRREIRSLDSSKAELGTLYGRMLSDRDRLAEAICTHRSQKADDRCIEDDDRLYEALGDGIKCDRRVGDKSAMLKNCARFIERRCEGGGWPSYVELEARLAKAPRYTIRAFLDDGTCRPCSERDGLTIGTGESVTHPDCESEHGCRCVADEISAPVKKPCPWQHYAEALRQEIVSAISLLLQQSAALKHGGGIGHVEAQIDEITRRLDAGVSAPLAARPEAPCGNVANSAGVATGTGPPSRDTLTSKSAATGTGSSSPSRSAESVTESNMRECPTCGGRLRVLGGGPQFDNDYVCDGKPSHVFRGGLPAGVRVRPQLSICDRRKRQEELSLVPAGPRYVRDLGGGTIRYSPDTRGTGINKRKAENQGLRLIAYRASEPEASALVSMMRHGDAFKRYVHKRLDDAGIPTHPNGPHSKEGCRVGDRLDIALARPVFDAEDVRAVVEAMPFDATLPARRARLLAACDASPARARCPKPGHPAGGQYYCWSCRNSHGHGPCDCPDCTPAPAASVERDPLVIACRVYRTSYKRRSAEETANEIHERALQHAIEAALPLTRDKIARVVFETTVLSHDACLKVADAIVKRGMA